MITTVVGSYPKIGAKQGPNLRAALTQFEQGRITEAELHRIEDEVTRIAINEQEEAGIDLVTDGQIRWEDGQTYFARRMKGFSISGLIRYFDTNTYYRQPVVEEAVEWREPIALKDFRFAQSVSSKSLKVVITGPYTLARLSKNTAYQDFGSLVRDLAKALNQEALALQKAGAGFIQFDEPAILKHKEDLPILAEAAQVLTKGITAKKAIYTYFGSLDGLYPDFLELPFDVFGLDFVMGEANFRIVKRFPEDKELGFGIVDARNTKLETVEDIVQGVKRISRVVPLDRLYLNPSCGLEFLPRPNANDKLMRLVEGAAKAKEALE